jgi:dienelactone hydrolase
MGQTVHFTTPNGGQVAGYLARAGGSAKNVIVLQEWWGLNKLTPFGRTLPLDRPTPTVAIEGPSPLSSPRNYGEFMASEK